MRPVIEMDDVTKLFGEEGVRHLDLQVPRGSIFGFIGPSGSGKTTTLRLLTGLLAPDTGTIRVLGEDPVDFERETRSRIGYLPQTSVLYPDLTIGENLSFSASVYGIPRKSRPLDSLLDFVELTDAVDRRLSDASGGMARRLGLAAALVHQPDLIFLDEPTAGIDPVLRQKFWERFRSLRDNGVTLFITTQYVSEAAYCDLVGVLSDGRLVIVDSPEELRRRAFGGELVDITFDVLPSDARLRDLGSALEATDRHILDHRRVRFVVPDAGRALPKVSGWADSNELDVEETEAYVPDFDEVFVEIVSADRAREPLSA